MALANVNLDALRERVLAAYNVDHALVGTFRDYARRIAATVRPLRTYSVNAVSFVSADGGDNRLTFNPALVELVRVVDSRGNECALDAIGSTTQLAELNKRIVPGTQMLVPPLQRLCQDTGIDVTGLSYLLSGIEDPNKSTGAIRCYRDIVEWAVLYDLVANPQLQWGGDTILIRDGLLRTKSFKGEVFPLIDQKIRSGTQRHSDHNVKLSLVGVAKHSAVLGRLAVSLELEGSFHKPFPCYAEVPNDIEAACYNYDQTWLRTYESGEYQGDDRTRYQSLGKMYLVKFGDRPFDPVWPVDIAIWQVQNAEKILGQLTVDAQQGFPIPDYPMSIQKAHDFAKIGGIEIEILQDLIMQGVTQNLTPDETERILRMKYLGKNLTALRYREG